MLKTALMAMQNLPPLAFFREADGLRDEALSSIAEFVQSVSSPDSPASKEERCLATQLLLELAVARGSLRCVFHHISASFCQMAGHFEYLRG